MITGGDNDKLAEKICFSQCGWLKNSCGQLLRCGNDQFDVSYRCPVTCAVGK